MNNNIAIIPARGGSKRIPRKNIIDFCGKPMIAWTIEAALQSNCFDKVLVSTDDDGIADISRRAGAEVPFLRAEKADDYSPISEATVSSLKQAEEYWSRSFNTVCQLMANCPLRTADDIRDAFENYRRYPNNFQISCFKFGWMNPWWAATIADDKQPRALHSQALNKRSQDLDELYCPTGAIWIADSKRLKESNSFYGEDHIFHPMSWESAVDIDDNDDLALAKAVRLMLDTEQ